jgi:hypothetical protein
VKSNLVLFFIDRLLDVRFFCKSTSLFVVLSSEKISQDFHFLGRVINVCSRSYCEACVS